MNPLSAVWASMIFLACDSAWAGPRQDPRIWIFGGAALVAGIVLFCVGFSAFKRKRLIENLPASKVRSMAVGLVELKVKAVDWNCLSAPFSGSPCVYYRYIVEEYRSNGKSSSWETVRHGSSEGCPFYVEDETGRTLVHPSGSKSILGETYRLETGMFSEVPSSVDAFLEATGFSCRSFLGFEKKLRFTEHHVEPGREIFVLGTCQANDRVVSQAYVRFLQAVLTGPPGALAAPSAIRVLGGGIAVGQREVPLVFPSGKNPDPPPPDDPVFVGQEKGSPFILSDKSERDLIRIFAFQAFGGVFGGIAMIALAAYLLLK